jgi:endoglucanase
MRNRAIALTGILLCFSACASSPSEQSDSNDSNDVTDVTDVNDDPPDDVDGGLPDIDGGPACSGSSAVAQPFGSHAQAYAAGSILPARPQDELDAATANFYEAWKSRYLRTGSPCPAGQTYVRTNHPDSMTVSEAHGYGMVILAFMAGHDPEAHTLFDQAYAYFRAHPSNQDSDRMAWSQNTSCQDANGTDSATDGDLDIAYALLLADKQWGSGGSIDYRAEAEKVIAAIRNGDVDNGNNYLLLGDWASPGDEFYRATRSSDFMPGHLESFGAATGQGDWGELNASLYDIIDAVQSGSTGLIPDFIVNAATSPAPAPAGFLENDSDGAYSYNACRNPWRIAVHYLVSGDSRAKALLTPLNAWIQSATGGDPGEIKPGYQLNGNDLGRNYAANAFNGPFGVGAMVDAWNQELLLPVLVHVNENDNNQY